MPKNIVLFIIACVVIIMGWWWLSQQLFPPRPRDPNQIAKKDAKKKDEPKKDDAKKDDDKKQAKAPEVKPEQKPEQKPEVKPKVEAKPEPAPQTVLLGGDDTHLQVLLTTRGAGVQKLTLNRFKAADYLGRPVNRNLELIPEDAFTPSYLMYHFAAVEDDDPPYGNARPVLVLGEKTWQLEGDKEMVDGVEQVRMSVRVPGHEHIKITKTYRLGPKDYHVTVRLDIEQDKGDDAKGVKFRYQLTGAHGLPIEGEWFTTIFRKGIIGVVDDRGTLSRYLENEDAHAISHRGGGHHFPERKTDRSMLQYAGVATQYMAAMLVVDNEQPDPNIDRKSILAWARPTLESTERSARIDRLEDEVIVVREGAKIVPYRLLPHVKRHIAEIELKRADQVMISSYETPDGQRIATWIRRGDTARPFLDDITVRVNSEAVALTPGKKVSHQFLLYHGPVKTRLLGHFSGDEAVAEKLVDRYTETLQLQTLTDYGTIGFFRTIGWSSLLIWTTKVMHGLLYYLSFVVFGNYGLSIILLTIIVRGLMFPISKKQALFSIRMQALAPELKKLQEKYKNDPQGKTQATMELYRKHNVHPLGGCLPMLLQLPIFLGLYYALQESISFRLAGFLWMDNLAAPDMLLWWSESIPYISDPDSQGGFFYLGPYLNLLPIFAVGLMFIQQKLMTPPPTDEQQAMNMKVMQFMMIFMGIVFYKVASGLCIYFIASSLWGLAERQLLPKKRSGEVAAATATPYGRAPAPKPRGKGPAKAEPDGMVRKIKDWWAKVLDDAKKK